MKKIFFATLFLSAGFLFSQDLLNLVDSAQAPKVREKTFATFKGIKVINAQSCETMKKSHLDFRVAHRFGNIATPGAGHQLFGLDAIADVRISFDYGVTDKLMIGIGRTKRQEMIDGSIKYKILEQTTDNHMPLTLVFYGDAGFTPVDKATLYSGTVNVKENIAHRLSYVSQLVLARKFSRALSLELLPTYQYRNFVRAYINPDNSAEESNGIFALGAALRLKLTKRICVTADYFYNFSQFRMNNPALPYYNALGIGFEIETGGHVFHINYTNNAGILENDFIPNNGDSWSSGAFKFGFNISRVFSLKKH